MVWKIFDQTVDGNRYYNQADNRERYNVLRDIQEMCGTVKLRKYDKNHAKYDKEVDIIPINCSIKLYKINGRRKNKWNTKNPKL